MSISVTIIGHNEGYHLKELLPTLNWADEVIYVDCESEDDSLQIATDHNCRVFSRPNNPNLNVNKSFAIEQAKSDWIFYLDPDERLPSALVEEIRKVLQSNPTQVAFRLNRRNHYFGKWLKHGSQYPDTQLRLFKKGKAYFPQQHVHEKLQINGTIGKLKNDMLHYPYLTVSQFLKKFDFYTTFEARYLFEKGAAIGTGPALKFLLITPLSRFIRRFIFKMGFLDGAEGFFAALFDALNYVVRYFKLREIYLTNGRKP